MLDTNVLISAALFPSAEFDALLAEIFEKHKLVLASVVTEEFLEVAKRKFPAELPIVERFLKRLRYKTIYTPKRPKRDLFKIRDPNDYPILYTAIKSKVDIFITGDKDFLAMRDDIRLPKIMTPAEFLHDFVK